MVKVRASCDGPYGFTSPALVNTVYGRWWHPLDEQPGPNPVPNSPLPWTGDEGYKKAEVTGGGVALEEVDPRTLESRLHAGLFLCGEILDAFGPIGGYNFLWAWCTGRVAGEGAAAALRRVAGS